MSPELVDVAVVGGGPAGASAAMTLAARGLRTVLFEAKKSPHEMLCGEFLSPECSTLLLELGVDLERLFPGAAPIREVTFAAPGSSRSTLWKARLPGGALGLSREALDSALLREAGSRGVEVCAGSRVTAVRGSLEAGFTLAVTAETGLRQVRARAVIGAQGKRSPLDAALGRQFLRRAHPFVALKAHFTGPPVGDRIAMHAFPGGYCGVSEIEGDRRNLCLLVSQPVFQRSSRGEEAPVDAFIAWMACQNERLGDWLRQAQPLQARWIAIAQVPFTPKPALERDILMAGDAAGLIAPLAGDGIAIALETGQLAGAHLARFLSGEWEAGELRERYPAAWKRRYARRFRLGRLLQPLLVRPAAASLAFRLLSSLPSLGSYLISNTRGSVAPRVPSIHQFEDL